MWPQDKPIKRNKFVNYNAVHRDVPAEHVDRLEKLFR